jgi:hypothetical protein
MTRIVTLDHLVLEHPMWKNPRTITALGNKDLLDLGEDLVERGQKQDVLVQQIKMEDGSIIELVIDGQRRCLALELQCKTKKKSKSSVEVRVTDYLPSPVELTIESSDRMLLDALAVGIKRAGLSSFEQTEAAVALRNHNPERTMSDVGMAIGRSESWVSRMVRARSLASPKLVTAWSKGKVTDEQFKDLADINPHDRQEEALGESLGLREGGGREAKAEARNKLKEKAQTAKAEKKAAKQAKKPAKAKKESKKAKATNGHAKSNPDVFSKAKPGLAEITGLIKMKKPSDPYVKGLMDGALYAQGEIAPDEFKPAWRTYLKQVQKIEERNEAN